MSLYDKLAVDKNSQPEEIKKAYHKLSKTNHPDKGGDAEKFKEIQHAYEILSDPERRQMYDMTGSENEQQQQQGHPFGGGMNFGFGGDLGSIFGNMFGGMGGMPGMPGMPGMGGMPGRRRKAPRGPDKATDFNLKLTEFYSGHKVEINMQQDRECGLCSATGALKSESCSGCRGQGMKILMRQIGPGMVQQSMQPCTDCNGEGKRILQVCHECSGKKYKTSKKTLIAKIDAGMTDGEKLRFEGECSDSPDYEKPGDLIVTILRTSSGDESNFDWQGNDLHLSHSVELSEAFLGFNASINGHPSGKPITLSWAGGPLMHDAVLVVKGLGMPVRNKKGEYGDLFVHIDISISSAEKREGWTVEQRAALKALFPDWSAPSTSGIPLNFQQ